MRKSFLYSSFSLLALTACDNKDSLIIEDFESGSFENWTMAKLLKKEHFLDNSP